MASNNHTPIGTIAKTYGVKGELIIRTSDPSYDLKEDWESIFLQIEGILVPFFISSLRPFKQDEWVVKFDWYDDKSQAEKLMGYPVFIPSADPEYVDNNLYFDQLLGFRFEDLSSGKSGIIKDYLEIQDNPLFEVLIDGEEHLIPAQDDLIESIDPDDQSIKFRLPEELI
jgi:16S rRNA processing protein RimM